MKKVLVTGGSGFIGKNLCAMLDRDENLEVLHFTRDNGSDELGKLLIEADFVFHLAGANRPKDNSEFDTTNRGLTETMVDYIETMGKNIPILFSSSTQAELNNSYGRSKKAAEDILITWSKRTGNPVFIYRLPGVFGKWSRPDYNSVVATFCNNIAQGKNITISDPTKTLPLVYVDDVVSAFLDVMRGASQEGTNNFYQVTPQFEITLGELAAKLQTIRDDREKLLVPNFEHELDRNLYATFTSYLDQDQIGYPLDMKSDERGWLAEFIKSPQFGQIYISRTNPGYTRGIHWHSTKIEKFLVIEGEAEIKLRQLQSEEIITHRVSGGHLKVVEMPAGYVHSIKNVGKSDMLLLIWSQQVFNPEYPDTYHQEV